MDRMICPLVPCENFESKAQFHVDHVDFLKKKLIHVFF